MTTMTNIALSTALGIDRDGLMSRFLAVNEFHGSNANFIITSLMTDTLRRGHGVCLVSLHNSLAHYHHVLTKTGALNLFVLKEKNTQLETIEITSEVREHLSRGNSLYDFWDGKTFSLQRVFSVVKDKVKKLLTTQSSACIIIDDLSHFLDMGAPLCDVLSFLQYCRTLLTIFSNVSLVVLTHVIAEEDTNLLATDIAHVADILVNISVLKTGHSNDVSGVMEVKERQGDVTSCNRWSTLSLYHFKVMDRHVKLYAPGTSMLRT